MTVGNKDIEHLGIGVKEEGVPERGTDRKGEKISRRKRIDSQRRGSLVDGGHFSPDFRFGLVDQTAGFDFLQLFESARHFRCRNIRVSRTDGLQNRLAGDVGRKKAFDRAVERIPENLTFQRVFFRQLNAEPGDDFRLGDDLIEGVEQ